MKRNEHFTINASMITEECRDLFCEEIGKFYRKHPCALNEKCRFRYPRIRHRIHCIATPFLDLSAQDEFLEATSLEDLLQMQDEDEDDHIWSNPRHYCSDFITFVFTSGRNRRGMRSF